jgi:F-type H+-transporting ATPase subunit delta
MTHSRVAHRYASALLHLTAEQEKPDAVAAGLMVVKNAVDASRDLRRFLESPVVSKEKKKEVLRTMFKRKVPAAVQLYLAGLVDKGRENALGEILRQYFLLRDESLGIVAVDVKTASKFTPKQSKALTQQLELYTQKKVRITFSLDTALKGGFVARIGDTMLDASITRQIEILRTHFKDGAFEQN